VSSQNPKVSPQLGVGTFVFQLFQKRDELGGVVAMLQLAVAAHMQVADEIVSLRQLRFPCLGGAVTFAT